MGSHRFFSREFVAASMSIGALLVVGLQGLLPLTVSADEVTSRSIQLSTSAAAATDVTYEAKFTVNSAIQAYVLEFCDDSPVIGATCTAPTGFTDASATLTSAETTASDSLTALNASTMVIDQTVAGAGTADIIINGLTNPTNATDATSDNGFYMRVTTYASKTDTDISGGSPTFTATTPGDYLDYGGFAMSIIPEINVTGTVQESMLFCVSGAAIDQDCGDANSTAPDVNLGVLSTSYSAPSTGNIWTQISTNAVNGAVVDLKSDATGCGGLELNGNTSSQCIAPISSGTGGFGSSHEVGFGVETGTAYGTTSDTNDTGSLIPYASSGYSTGTYNLNYASDNTTGITSPYGDPFLETGSTPGPVNNQNMELTFGAVASPNTAAGNYSANMDMIATGTF
jgi:hypothetical protein